MPELKLKLKDPGAIHLMALDTSSEFLPFGRPLSDYLRGVEGNQNGSRALLNQGPVAFSPAVRYESLNALLKATGFGGFAEQEEIAEPEAPAAEPDPAVADFLPFEWPDIISSEEAPPRVAPAMEVEDLPVSIPRVAALPLRPRMTFGPPPAPKVKPPSAPPPKPAAPTPVAKSTPVVAAPPKPAAPAPTKPAAPAITPKPPAPAPVQAKPAATVPPPPKASPVPTPVRATTPPAPAARTPEPPKQSPSPTRVTVSRPAENVAAAADTNVATPPKPPAPQVRTAAPAAPAKPPAPPVPVATSPAAPVEQAPAHEVIAREAPKAKEPEPNKSAPVETTPVSIFEPKLGSAEQAGFFERIPMVAKIGAAVVILAGGLYFTMGGKSAQKPADTGGSEAVVVGEQGWSTEWASDTGGSKRARQLTMYRPSVGMSDYQLQFVGQIETKALGWIFRAFDTKNYYAMKIETLRPGTMGLTHFAVVDGRESSYSQKPLTIDARPGAPYRIKLDVSGPRFTVSIGGEPVDFWTDNRLKVGAVGFMNERDERGAASSVQFSFPKVSK